MIRPELRLTVGEHELSWTYGLQLDLQRLVPSAEDAINAILSETYIRDYLLRRTLTPVRKSIVDESELIKIEDVDLDPDQVLQVLDWITGHLLYFFASSANSLSAKGAELQISLPSQSSTNGSED